MRVRYVPGRDDCGVRGGELAPVRAERKGRHRRSRAERSDVAAAGDAADVDHSAGPHCSYEAPVVAESQNVSPDAEGADRAPAAADHRDTLARDLDDPSGAG